MSLFFDLFMLYATEQTAALEEGREPTVTYDEETNTVIVSANVSVYCGETGLKEPSAITIRCC